jgi:hypothetical protein
MPVPARKTRRLARPRSAAVSAPASAPAPNEAERMPNASGPAASVSRARTGSSTFRLNAKVVTASTVTSTTATGRVRRTNRTASRTPRTRPGASPSRSSGKSSAGRIRSSETRTARKLAAFTAKQIPTPTHATRTPPSAGPTTRAALKSVELSATAFASSSRPTIWNVSACRPGLSRTRTIPRSAVRT